MKYKLLPAILLALSMAAPGIHAQTDPSATAKPPESAVNPASAGSALP